jgi:hypothetical protein
MTWIEVYKRILKGGIKEWKREKERLSKMIGNDGAEFLLKTNIQALDFYFTKDERGVLKSYSKGSSDA